MSGSPIGALGFIKEGSAFVVRGNPLGTVLIPLGRSPVLGRNYANFLRRITAEILQRMDDFEHKRRKRSSEPSQRSIPFGRSCCSDSIRLRLRNEFASEFGCVWRAGDWAALDVER